MSERDNGGPAFPMTSGNLFTPGMSLRDWFAGQAIAGMAPTAQYRESTAEAAYAMADALLAERRK